MVESIVSFLMTNWKLLPIGAFGIWLIKMIFGSRLMVLFNYATEKEEGRQVVVVHYPMGPFKGVYVRVLVRNSGFFSARNCVAYLNEVARDGAVLDKSKQPLRWTHLDEFSPITIERNNSQYVDVCSTDEHNFALRVHSAKGEHYAPYKQTGVYTFVISAEGHTIGIEGEVSLRVQFNDKLPMSLCVLDVKKLKTRIRWW